jgi:hypothetical protein
VISKNLADRRMSNFLTSPDILLLKNTLDIGSADMQSEID